jgi:lipopolysaccharide transport system ATP-binding protein
MSDIAIRVDHLGKRYMLEHQQQGTGSYTTLREVIADGMKSARRRLLSSDRNGASDRRREEFWALKDVSFAIRKGEVLGIVGRNGAGKSTLLKLLSRITEPTQGRISIRGRVGSLLEVGTGFHPELTGRENIYLNGAILGMLHAEIKRQFDAIVAFAQVERFLDTPVKRYSSGMYVRLAFAVAAHLNPEILIVDEVLAVGDAAFQKKCLGKMQDVSHQEGRTVLFVSHNMMAMQGLCHRVLWLNGGAIVKDGSTKQVIADYLCNEISTERERIWHDPRSAPGNEKVRIHRAYIRPEATDSVGRITLETPVRVGFEFWNLVADARLSLSVVLYNQEGIIVLNTVGTREAKWLRRPAPVGRFRSEFRLPGNLLNDGTYRVELYVVEDLNRSIFRQDDILCFEVHETTERPSEWYGKWAGAVRPDLEWQTEFLEPEVTVVCQ